MGGELRDGVAAAPGGDDDGGQQRYPGPPAVPRVIWPGRRRGRW